MKRSHSSPAGYRVITDDEYRRWERQLAAVILDGLDEEIRATTRWLDTPAAAKFFHSQNARLAQFLDESHLTDEWENIIRRRAAEGVDITRAIYDYACSINMAEYIPALTPQQRTTLNMLCDNTYEHIRNVNTDMQQSIRRSLMDSYVRGERPSRYTLDGLKLEPINGLSPEKRAEMIARTESARTLNLGNLDTLRTEGVHYVTLLCGSDACPECLDYQGSTVPVDEAMNLGLVHPNCRCSWIPIGEE